MTDEKRFEFLNNLSLKLGNQAEAFGLLSLNKIERTVLLNWWAKGILDNGGFRYFYEGASNIDQVAEAFEAIGFRTAAAACVKSSEVFPNRIPQETMEERNAWMDEQGEHLSRVWDDLNRRIWEIDEKRFDTALFAFVSKNASDLGIELPM